MHRIFLIFAALCLLSGPLAAQVALPGVQVPRVGDVIGPLTQELDRRLDRTARLADRLAQDRLREIDRFVRRNGDLVERDAAGDPARRGELLVLDASPAMLGRARAAGFAVIESGEIEGLGIAFARLRTPGDSDLADAERDLARLLPEATVSADTLHFQSGVALSPPLAVTSRAAAAEVSGAGGSAPVGMIDGAPGKAVPVAETRGFAQGAPVASNHGSAVASLLASAGAGPIRVADVYGTDQAGGNALAIARGLGWLADRGSRVVVISLVGPKNPVLARAVAAARSKGVVVVAAVGNGGPAAPLAYPASYEGVVSVTAVDGRGRALIEAGRALDLDYAAPGADVFGLNAGGKRVRLRGTSFATPLAAARVAHALASGRNWRARLDAEAVDLGRKGRDDTFGRGLLCAECRGR
ncbi:S8 family serine peptidase [Pelagerythrobacter marensis]|uniref:Extracellular protease n=1 Tax=Pelagerythrobacter marensis TaxID=543877 RepID=A0A0G3XAS2_9SPHN|nr:S8 family serine peptidase [Pelagerythrobacter marensis]AKM07699.1 Extracellular protease [Pelagerythrobacter marensis]